MEYRRLGKSGLQLSALSMGSWVTFGNQIDDKSADALMHHAYDNGVNFFDNAEAYANGESEIVMGKILKRSGWSRLSYVVSSKVFWGDPAKPNSKGLMRKHLVEACHDALNRLQLDYIDLYFCHRPDPNTPIDEVVWTMHNLFQQGKILYWGTSEWEAEQITEAHLVAEKHHLLAPVMEQPQYNLFERQKVECDYLPLYDRFGLGTTIWSPLASGFLTGKYFNGVPEGSRFSMENLSWLRDRYMKDSDLIKQLKALHAIAEELEMSMAQLALSWCLTNQNVSSVILGATNLQQLKENLIAMDKYRTLTDEHLASIEAIVNNKPKPVTY